MNYGVIKIYLEENTVHYIFDMSYIIHNINCLS